ncbi:MAG: ParB/RepB/Spo0J family partition protein, partial [Proteobacteria bacterium]|nr:ParB/RepB/Spo0J family partition protein [Pseudomonadota bacterium]
EGPGPYCMSFGFGLDQLILSIQRFGLINPPVTAMSEQGKVDVIAGYRRILALKALGWDGVECRDFSESLPSPLERLLFNLHDNLPTRPFNDMEKGMILARLALFVPEETLLKEYMPLLGLPSHEPLLQAYMRTVDLKEPVQKALANGRVSLRTVRALLELDEAAQRTLSAWLVNIIFNLNQQMHFIEYARDISMREGISISELLDDKDLVGVLQDREGRGSHKAKKVLEMLRRRRFPRLTRSQEIFEERVKRLKLPDGVRVRYDPYFEDPNYQIEISFREGRSLREKVITLSQSEGLGKLGDPWLEDS